VIAMAGEANRKIFFGNQNLALHEGYRIFFGAVPKLKDIDLDDSEFEDNSEFIKRLLLLLRRERINEGAPKVYVSTTRILRLISIMHQSFRFC
jgi:hypothetical protein